MRRFLIALVLCVACQRGRSELRLASPPATAVPVREASAFLHQQIRMLSEHGAVKCGDLQSSRLPLRCAEHALDSSQPFYAHISGRCVTSSTGRLEQKAYSLMAGDGRGNVTWYSFDPWDFPRGGGFCGVGAPLRHPPALPGPRLVTVTQRRLIVNDTAIGQPPFMRPARLVKRVPVSDAPYPIKRTVWAEISIDRAGAVTRCVAMPLLGAPVCDAVTQWQFIPATFLGRPLAQRQHYVPFRVDGYRITPIDLPVR